MSSRKVFTKVTLNLIQGLPPELWSFRNTSNAGGRFRIKYTMTCLHNNYTKSGSSRLETCRDDSSLLNSAVRGFTLIELLVVVLIIGILSAVALPQYQKAVENSHIAEAKIILNTMRKNYQLCVTEFGANAETCNELSIFIPDNLSIDLPGSWETDVTKCPNVGSPCIITRYWVYDTDFSNGFYATRINRANPEKELYALQIKYGDGSIECFSGACKNICGADRCFL